VFSLEKEMIFEKLTTDPRLFYFIQIKMAFPGG
jgi:hypothetical protein